MTKGTNIYLDYAAATPLDPSVLETMRAWEDTHFANAFSTHAAGKEIKRALEDARFAVAAHLNVQSNECFFTSGATNGTITALHGIVGYLVEKGVPHADMHVVVSVLEHSSVRSCLESLSRRGVRISLVPASSAGVIDVQQLKEALSDDTVLVASMLVNNELGTIAPLREVAAVITERYNASPHRFVGFGVHKPALFVDASQAVTSMPVAPHELGADALIMDAGKIYGPKRTGLLYVRKGTPFAPWCGMHGEVPYEGTPDVASVLGFSQALKVVKERREQDAQTWRELKAYLVQALNDRFPGVRIHGDATKSVPGICNFSFPDVEGEFLAAQLDHQGIAVSAKSACLSGGLEGSYVVQAVDPERVNNAVRVSFGRGTTRDDIDVLVSTLSDIVKPV